MNLQPNPEPFFLDYLGLSQFWSTTLGIKHPSGAYDQIFITVWQLRVCWFGAPSLTRGRVCRLQLLLALASAVIFGSESRRTLGHILLSQIRDFPFRRLLRLAGSRWRYSLTHSWSWALLEKLPIVQLLENFPAFYGTRRFITAFT
jgi:hypothetical protein